MPSPPVPIAKPFDLDTTLPWGRNRTEYMAMFDLMALLGNGGRRLKILDCGGGPSSFTAEMVAEGFEVVSSDPLYRSSEAEIKARIGEARAVMMESVRAAAHRFVWDDFKTPEALEAARLSAMKFFLEDYEDGLEAGRYVDGALPELPFEDKAFDLALSSHFLFLYSAQLDLDFHLAAIAELLRVAGEVRIFPMLDLDGNLSTHLAPVVSALKAQGLAPELRAVPYEFQRGGNRMLRIADLVPK